MFISRFYYIFPCPGLCWQKSGKYSSTKLKDLRGFSYSKNMAIFEAFVYGVLSRASSLYLWRVSNQMHSLCCLRLWILYDQEKACMQQSWPFSLLLEEFSLKLSMSACHQYLFKSDFQDFKFAVALFCSLLLVVPTLFKKKEMYRK